MPEVNRRSVPTRQKAANLYRLWHSIQDIKDDAEQMKDKELVLLVGMMELVVQERTASLTQRGATLAVADRN
jgi:hypothetical protein